jgi:hypothetical protein
MQEEILHRLPEYPIPVALRQTGKSGQADDGCLRAA